MSQKNLILTLIEEMYQLIQWTFNGAFGQFLIILPDLSLIQRRKEYL